MGGPVSDWRRTYARRLAVVDSLVVLWAMAGALVVRFGALQEGNPFDDHMQPYLVLTLILSFAWWLALGLAGSRETTVLGYGTDEYKRVVAASFWVFGLVAVFSYAFRLEIARGYVIIALPAGVISLVIARKIIRNSLRDQRRNGNSASTVLLIGGAKGVEHLANAMTREPMAGYLPVATYLPSTHASEARTDVRGLPNLGTDPSPNSITQAIEVCRPDAVALSSGVPLAPQTIRELGWRLADLNIKMILAPALTDIAGPRIHTQPLAGLPLIHVSTPNLRNWQRWAKRAFDLVGASALLCLLAPFLLMIGIVVRIDSPGPVLFRQLRVGAQGQPFLMYKYRSMVADAEDQLEQLRSLSEGNGVLFKLKVDPRVTRVGRFLRRFSLDELPQLLNVLNGTMSLVGPRPPLPDEVEQYQRHVHRRLMVRPGLTGLWQVSGRSLLSWDDSVRLDLYYVENWSLLGDMAILLRTVKAVIGRHGAY